MTSLISSCIKEYRFWFDQKSVVVLLLGTPSHSASKAPETEASRCTHTLTVAYCFAAVLQSAEFASVVLLQPISVFSCFTIDFREFHCGACGPMLESRLRHCFRYPRRLPNYGTICTELALPHPDKRYSIRPSWEAGEEAAPDEPVTPGIVRRR